MKKNTVIYLVAGIVALIIIGLSIYFAVAHNNTSDNRYDTKNITIEKYNENGELEKTVEIKRKKDINELLDICKNISLEQDDTSKSLGIKTDVKINLQNGVELYLQDEIKDYCFYKIDDVKCTIKMPEGLVDFVNDVLKD